MKKPNDSGCLFNIVFYVVVIIVPVIILGVFDLNSDLIGPYVLSLIIGFFVGGFAGLSLFSEVKPEIFAKFLCVISIYVVAFICLLIIIHLFNIPIFETP